MGDLQRRAAARGRALVGAVLPGRTTTCFFPTAIPPFQTLLPARCCTPVLWTALLIHTNLKEKPHFMPGLYLGGVRGVLPPPCFFRFFFMPATIGKRHAAPSFCILLPQITWRAVFVHCWTYNRKVGLKAKTTLCASWFCSVLRFPLYYRSTSVMPPLLRPMWLWMGECRWWFAFYHKLYFCSNGSFCAATCIPTLHSLW